MAARHYPAPRLLSGNDDLSLFDCRSAEQTEWLQRRARQAHSTGTARVYVVTEHNSSVVVGYYAWCMASLEIDIAPDRLRKGAGRYPQPVALLARLGVDASHENRQIGRWMLKHAVENAIDIGVRIGCRGLLIHAESERARDFYTRLSPDFEPLKSDRMKIVLMMKDLRKMTSERTRSQHR